MANEEIGKPVPVRDRLDVPTYLVDGIRGMSVHDGMVTLNMMLNTFGTPGGDLDGSFENTVCRMAMPLPAFVRIAHYFNNQLELLERDKHIKRAGDAFAEDTGDRTKD